MNERHTVYKTNTCVVHMMFSMWERSHFYDKFRWKCNFHWTWTREEKTSKAFKMIGLHVLVRSFVHTLAIYFLVSGSLVRDFDFFPRFAHWLGESGGKERIGSIAIMVTRTHTNTNTHSQKHCLPSKHNWWTRSWKMWNTLAYGRVAATATFGNSSSQWNLLHTVRRF